MLLMLSLALAKDVRTPPPELVTTIGDGITFARPGDELEGGDPEAPTNDSQAASEAYIREMETYKDRRADLEEADLTMRYRAPLIADCAAKANVAPGATASVTVTFNLDGTVRARAKGAGDTGLAGCASTTLDKQAVGALLHTGKTLAPTWTLTFTGPPTSVPSAIDLDGGFAGVAFGGATAGLRDGHLTDTHGNARHYNRMIDDNARYLGVPVVCILDFEAEFGLYGASVRVEGDAASYILRQNLKVRFGQGKWDNDLKAWYWRGDRRIYVVVRPEDSTFDLLRIVDMDLARKGKLVESFPGDPSRSEMGDMRRLPRVLQNPPGSHGGTQPPAAAPAAPTTPDPAPSPPPSP